MSIGKPVITTDVKPISDPIENGITGYLIPPGDSDALAAAVLGTLKDAAQAGRIGAAGRQSVISSYSWIIVAQQLGDILQKVLDSHAPWATGDGPGD